MNKAVQAVIGLGLLCFGASQALATAEISKLQRVTQKLVAPPAVPQHDQVAKGGPKVVQVRMETVEKQIEVAPGVKVWALTFNGSVPGPLIVVHEGDYVELTLVNPKESTLAHNVDFHAATGALGAAGLTLVQPGEEVVVRFKAIKPGVFVYHCAPGGTMIPFHVISGMSGAIMVLPRDGLKDAKGKPYTYDKAYYIGEQDFYLPKDDKGNYKSYAQPAAGMADMLEVAKGLIPTHIVFNGAVGAITGDNALSAKVGEKVLFIHSQANRPSYPHLIGGHADLYWVGGSFSDTPLTSQETWFVPAGSAVAAAYEFKQPGLYVYLSHNLIEAVLLGAAAHMMIEGDWNDDLMKQLKAPASFDAKAAMDH
ncbi:MAG: copper-containing nitrite reductase [Nitrosomonas sp.]|nr:copper-containing nitrite reductase [Nitrosomonas sp.]MDP1951845.1 copper-containing nitrite reductase [Nitrosomonas sp.]